MTEIRIAANIFDKSDSQSPPVRNEVWYPDSPDNREMLRIILESDLEIYGQGTHWIEVRDECLNNY
jgi:hypothetical protein